MAILTFMSDFGTSDSYVASVKGRILTADPNQTIIDVSHTIKQYDIAHGSYVLRSCFRDFPLGTVHLVAVNSTGSLGESYIAIELDGHYFVGTDNGLLSLISTNEPQQVVILGTNEDEHTLARQSTFPCRDILVPAALKILKGTPLASLGETTAYLNKMLFRTARVTPKLIAGHVIYIDNYGNLITNIRKDQLSLLESQEFFIKIGREEVRKINRTYSITDPGDLFAVINSEGYLEIGIHSGNAAELLGMEFDSPILVRLRNGRNTLETESKNRISGRLPL
jgi:S-adenosylmethionine hydrolase